MLVELQNIGYKMLIMITMLYTVWGRVIGGSWVSCHNSLNVLWVILIASWNLWCNLNYWKKNCTGYNWGQVWASPLPWWSLWQSHVYIHAYVCMCPLIMRTSRTYSSRDSYACTYERGSCTLKLQIFKWTNICGFLLLWI